MFTQVHNSEVSYEVDRTDIRMISLDISGQYIDVLMPIHIPGTESVFIAYDQVDHRVSFYACARSASTQVSTGVQNAHTCMCTCMKSSRLPQTQGFESILFECAMHARGCKVCMHNVINLCACAAGLLYSVCLSVCVCVCLLPFYLLHC